MRRTFFGDYAGNTGEFLYSNASTNSDGEVATDYEYWMIWLSLSCVAVYMGAVAYNSVIRGKEEEERRKETEVREEKGRGQR